MPQAQRVIVSVPMDEKMVEQLEDLCEVLDRPRTWIVRKAMEQYLKAEGYPSLNESKRKS